MGECGAERAPGGRQRATGRSPGAEGPNAARRRRAHAQPNQIHSLLSPLSLSRPSPSASSVCVAPSPLGTLKEETREPHPPRRQVPSSCAAGDGPRQADQYRDPSAVPPCSPPPGPPHWPPSWHLLFCAYLVHSPIRRSRHPMASSSCSEGTGAGTRTASCRRLRTLWAGSTRG